MGKGRPTVTFLSGDCKRCGECCRLLILPLPPRMLPEVRHGSITLPLPVNSGEELYEFLRARGGRLIYDEALGCQTVSIQATSVRVANFHGQRSAYIKSTCAQLVGNDCRLWGKPGRPYACVAGPVTADELLASPGCGYKFEEEPIG